MRIVEDMRAQAAKMTDRATGYAMCGESELAGSFRFAANKLLAAVSAIEIAAAAEREAQEAA